MRARGPPDASMALRYAAELTKCYHSAHEAGQAGVTHATSPGRVRDSGSLPRLGKAWPGSKSGNS